MKFLRNLLAAILGCLIAFGIFFFMFFIFIALIGSGENDKVIEDETILEFELDKIVFDYNGKDPSDPFASLLEEGIGMDEILHAIAVAKADTRIKGISLKPAFIQTGLAQTQELRRAISDFKTSGKFVYAYGDFYTQKDYYLASAADSIFLNPQGVMEYKGLASEILYLKELQEKTGIKMEVVRHGKYKSAVEPFLSNEMSEENRSQISELLFSLWEVMNTEIATSRNKKTEELNLVADTLGARLPKMAVATGLVDALQYLDEYDNLLKSKLGLGADAEIPIVSIKDYSKAVRGRNTKTGKDKIAIIYAQGEILYGEGDRSFIGQGNLTKALRKARTDKDIKAVVMRVNSPGGSSMVSDMIWREVELTKATKPVVVSFGNVAASGGYYIAAAANKIFAEPTTITGSIGVFGTIPNFHELATNVGINAEQVTTHAQALEYSPFEPMQEAFRMQILESIEQTYDTFLGRVAEGRNMTKSAVDSIAQGRVWSGVDALNNGLIDELGSLDDAIKAAANLAQIENYGIRKYPKFKSELSRMLEDLGGAKAMIRDEIIKEELGDLLYQSLKSLKPSAKPDYIQAKMPFEIQIN